MIACDTKALAAISLGSGPLTGIAMFKVTQATKARHSARTDEIVVAAINIRSHSTGKSPYGGRNGLRSEARIKMVSHINGCSLRVSLRIPKINVVAKTISV